MTDSQKITEDKIVLIGAGNMATRLAVALVGAGYDIAQIYSRTLLSATSLSQRLGNNIPATNRIEEIRQDASLYIFSISDAALPDVVAQLPANNALWIHTAGSMPIEVFSEKTSHYGVLYPMQTASRERELEWSEIPIFIEASTATDTERIEQMACRLSHNVTRSNTDQRRALHLAAVFACNFSNHMYAIAEHLLAQQGLPFDVMKFLIRETEHKAETISPQVAQTGPAARGDQNVMKKHLALLGDTPEGELYQLISNNIDRYLTTTPKE